MRPIDRSLPSLDVTADSIANAYVRFILYCNPHFPLDVDTAMLQTKFTSPPQSDNKDFETFRLFELIQKLDAKEIKTWGQLALDLGVEPPDTSKGQSVQKVQQYTVRLKRWMRAMHIDAFFELLMGKQHSYFLDIPDTNDPYPAGGRDGVPAEEDLAIRALDPSFRPKRGRRRNSETEQEDAEAGPANKQPRLEGTDHFGQLFSAYPASAHPDSYNDPWAMASAVTPQSYAPWANKPMSHSAITTTAPSQLRWQLHGSSQNVSNPHPMTAHPGSMATHIDAAFDNELRSATTRATKRKRKHGPAVSSAWPSTNAPGAKPRGRPPANRSTQDGPFGTFPADPLTTRGSAPAGTVTPEPAPTAETRPAPPMPPPVRRQSEGPGRLTGRLSLQVPQHTGGPVRLATPPPRVLVNGETNDSSDSRNTSITPTIEAAPSLAQDQAPRQRVVGSMEVIDREIPGFAFEVLKRVLASDLLRAELTGRQQRLSGDEAKRLADAVLQRLGVPRQKTDESNDDIARLTTASWLGLGEQLNVPLGPATSQGKRISVTRFRTDAEGYEEIVSAQDATIDGVREVYDLAWTVSMAGCNGNFELKGLTLSDSSPAEGDSHETMLKRCFAAAKEVGNENASDDPLSRALRQAVASRVGNSSRYDDDGVDWKAKCLAYEMGGRMAMGEYSRLRSRLIERVLEVLM